MSEYRFKIEAYTKDSIPMEVLARYLVDLADVLGTPHAVHFDRLEEGSVVPVIRIETEALPKVTERVNRVKSGNGPVEAVRAFHSINRRLQEDNGTGFILDATGAEIIRFPGREAVEQAYSAIRRQGTLDGEIIRVGGRDRARVRIMLQTEDRTISNVHARKAVAKDLGNRLYEQVRLFGVGRWTRDVLGTWNLEDFSVDHFEVLKTDNLATALTKLRAISGGEWAADSYDEIRDLRRDDPDKES